MSTVPTVTLRPLDYADIATAAAADAGPIAAYKMRPHSMGQVAVQTTLTPQPSRGAHDPGQPPHTRVFGLMSHWRDPDRVVADGSVVLGHLVKFETRDVFGRLGELSAFTSAEAEDAYLRLHPEANFRHHRTSFGVAAKDGTEVHLMPEYGSEATLNLVVPDIDAAEIRDRAVAALMREFGADARVVKALSRPVPDVRVDVYKEGTLKAVNVLASIAHLVVPLPHETRPHDGDVVIGS